MPQSRWHRGHPDECEPIKSNDDFYGGNSGKLNAFIQWVYVPAVKDAQEEGEESKKSALGQLLARTVRATTDFGEKIAELKKETLEKFETLLEDNQAALTEVSENLKIRLAEPSAIPSCVIAFSQLELNAACAEDRALQRCNPSAAQSRGWKLE